MRSADLHFDNGCFRVMQIADIQEIFSYYFN